MAKVRVKEAQRRVEVALRGIVQSSQLLTYLAELARDRIYSTTKSGYFLGNKNEGIEKTKLQPLSEGYKKFRKRAVKKGFSGGPLFGLNRSNLTFSGQMLEALTYRVERLRSSFSVFVKDTQRAKTPQFGKSEPLRTNAEVAAKVAIEGRPFLGISETLYRRLKNEVIKDIRKKLRKLA